MKHLKTAGKFLLLALIILFNVSCSNTANIEASTEKSNQDQAKMPKAKPLDGQLVFRLADNLADGSPTILADKEFARLVEERSKGRMKIIVFANASLGDETSCTKQVRLGGIDFARVNSATLVEYSDKLAVLSLPYLFRDTPHMWNVLQGPVGTELLDSLKENKILGLAYYDSGARSFYSKKPIYSISDLKGQKIRIFEKIVFEDLVGMLGSTPVELAFSEVFDALQTGKVDAAENNWSSYYYTNHYKAAKYYLADEHTRNPEILIVNQKMFNGLPKEYQDIISSSAKDSVTFQRKVWAEYEKLSEEAVQKAGTVITKLSDSDKKALESMVSPIYEKYGSGYKSIIDRIKETK